MTHSDVHGVIVVDKPPGVTSRRVVDAVSRTLSTKTVGHAGTLDPLAAGVVVVCVGHATKLVDFIHQQEKAYTVSFLFGRSSPSDDLETELTIESDPKRPSLDQVVASVSNQCGVIQQVPCVYSAKKIGGKRAYKLARLGQTVTLKPKEVCISDLEITSYAWPKLELTVVCSSGTFVRAVGRDIANDLGTTAVMETLLRTAVGPYKRTNSLPLAAITPDERGQKSLGGAFLPLVSAVPHLSKRVLTPFETDHASRGGHLENTPDSVGECVAALDEEGNLVGVLKKLASGGWRLRPNFIDSSPHS